MKKLIALLLAACLMLGLMTTAFAADEKSNDIVILYTNDVHCAVDDNIGYAGLAAYKKEMQAAYNYVALVDCGDSVQGDVIGTVELKLAGETIGVVNLIAGQDVSRSSLLYSFSIKLLCEKGQVSVPVLQPDLHRQGRQGADRLQGV